MEAKIMTQRQEKNHGTGYPAGVKIMISELGNIFCCHMYFYHGASYIAWRKKLLSSADIALLPIISLRTLTGFKSHSFAVRIMVMMIETLRLPCSVILPNDIFLYKTAFLMPCSAKLFVEGYRWVFKEYQQFIFEVNQAFANIVRFVVFEFWIEA